MTWEQIDERHGIYTDVHTVNVMADDPRALVATTGKGAYRSFDAGDSWQLSSDGLGDRRYQICTKAARERRHHTCRTFGCCKTTRSRTRICEN